MYLNGYYGYVVYIRIIILINLFLGIIILQMIVSVITDSNYFNFPTISKVGLYLHTSMNLYKTYR